MVEADLNHEIKISLKLYEARWQNKKDFSCYSNTINGAVEILRSFIPEEDNGFIYIYEKNRFIKSISVPPKIPLCNLNNRY